MDEETSRRLAATTRFADIRQLARVDSTNRFLLDVAQAGAPEGVVVVTDHQSAGRGRRGRSWEAPPGGALLVSVLLRPDPAVIPPERRWLVTAATALAAADACGQVAGAQAQAQAEIKWPNDLLVGDAKLAGILAEASGGAVVVGVGINVAWAPPGAACLGPAVDRGDLLAALLTNLDRWCDRWDEVAPAYRNRCATVGRQVRVELPVGAGAGAGAGAEAGTRCVVGRAVAVEADGALRVATEKGTFSFHAADVIHVTGP